MRLRDLNQTDEDQEAEALLLSLARFNITEAKPRIFKTPQVERQRNFGTPAPTNSKTTLKPGQVRFGEFKARAVPKSTYERPSKRKAAKGLLLNKSSLSKDSPCKSQSSAHDAYAEVSATEISFGNSASSQILPTFRYAGTSKCLKIGEERKVGVTQGDRLK